MATADGGCLPRTELEVARLVSNLKEKYPELADETATDLVLRFNGNENGIDNHILEVQMRAVTTTSSTQNYPSFSLNSTDSTLSDGAREDAAEAVYSRDRIQSEHILSSHSSAFQDPDPRLAMSYPWFPIAPRRSASPLPGDDVPFSSCMPGAPWNTTCAASRTSSNYTDYLYRSSQSPLPGSSTSVEQMPSVFNNSFNSSGGSGSELSATRSPEFQNAAKSYVMKRPPEQMYDSARNTPVEPQGERGMLLPSFHPPDQSLDLDSSIHRSDIQSRNEEERLQQQHIRYNNISKAYLALCKEMERVRTELSNVEKRIVGNECAKNPTSNDIKILGERTAILREDIITMMEELDKMGDTALIGAEEPPHTEAVATASMAVVSPRVPWQNGPSMATPLTLPTPLSYQQGVIPPPSYDQRVHYPLAPPSSFRNDPPPDYSTLSPASAEPHPGPMLGATASPVNPPQTRDDAEHDGKWNCPRCTFSNHIALPECEVCEWKRT